MKHHNGAIMGLATKKNLGGFEQLSELEWLETNGLGGWASSTVSGAHTRRYHGLLVAATQPPVGRTVLVSKLDDTLHRGTDTFELSTNRFPNAIHPRGFEYLVSFERDLFPVFEYEADGLRLRKTVAAVHGENTTLVVYEILEADAPVRIELRLFITSRDHHALGPGAPLCEEVSFEGGTLTSRPEPEGPVIFIRVPKAIFDYRPDWHRNFEYQLERRRGFDYLEDLWTPGVFGVELAKGERLGVVISAENPGTRDACALLEAERRRREELLAGLPVQDAFTRALVLAADQFVVTRGDDLRTIIAGYHWFGDWGRDTMVALPGLCLVTGRYEDARKILRAFAGSTSEGMLPNRFPDRGEEPEYNTVDATLWFFVAIHKYLESTGDEAFVRDELLPVLRDILAWHDRGTRYGIGVAEDGLLLAGETGVQLTWMDAKVGDWVVTPRHGKAVEVNALWHNALAILANLEKRLGDGDRAAELTRRAEKVRRRFVKVFWNEEQGCLFDVVQAGRADASIRPNQIFALSLPFALLPKTKARKVLTVVRDHLLTPFGLRSLSPDHPDYRSSYSGDVVSRDGAYHQGTVWSWLLGPFVTSLVRHGGKRDQRAARALLDEAGQHLSSAALGSYSEIFDADPPHAARGAVAQAWSVAELLRALVEDVGTRCNK
jgi:predicted glycogen debranching enzyme